MDTNFQEIIYKATSANNIESVEEIQNLWSGYGKILRLGLSGSKYPSVVVKHVKLIEPEQHPRGWNTDLGHQRKLKSYKVETAWYQQWSILCNNSCRVPTCFAIEHLGNEVVMVMEDLDASGFAARKQALSWSEIENCLNWLANFHATFLHQQPENLWQVGTYWHLETRPEELNDLSDKKLKKAAKSIDKMLSHSKYLTFVHGDAKLANFCFSDDGSKVAAVDFQYVGGGCGMKDVAYFIGSCLYEDDCERLESKILNSYFSKLQQALNNRKSAINYNELESEWRNLYPVAWTDFHRFLKGWSPGHWKINSYSEKLSKQVVAQLK